MFTGEVCPATQKSLKLVRFRKNYKADFLWRAFLDSFPAGIYLLKFNNRNTRTRCKLCSKLTKNTPERRYWCLSGVFIVNFEHILDFVRKFLLLILNM